jgi:hypothetical protein
MYRDYEHFRREVLGNKAGPLVSATEDIADEMYRQDFGDDFKSLWDDIDLDE